MNRVWKEEHVEEEEEKKERRIKAKKKKIQESSKQKENVKLQRRQNHKGWSEVFKGLLITSS